MNASVAERAICLSCATVFQSDYESDLDCVSCGRIIPRQRYTRLVRSAAAAARYGFQYRDRYRADAQNGPLHSRYCLAALDAVFTWIALAVISGVLGNASWESIQKVIKKILDSNATMTGESHNAVIELIEDTDKLERFATDVLAFNRRVRIESDLIEAAVEEEYVVDLMIGVISDNPEVSSALTSAGSEERKVLVAGLVAAMRAAQAEAAPLTEEEVEDLWAQVEISG